MGEKPYLIMKERPKKIEYLEKLLNYDKPETFLEKAKTYIGQEKTRSHSIWRWAEILGSTKDNRNTTKFLKKLAEQGALEKQGTTGKPPNEKPVYSVNKDKLIKVFYESQYYDWHRDLFFLTVKNAEPNRKIVTDF